MIKVSVPGKVHLLGEHIIVYGKPALLSAINLRVTVTIEKRKNDGLSILRNTINKLIQKKYHRKIPDYSIESSIPVGSGLGFSAAASAAIIAALLTYFKVNWDKNLINELAFEAEKIFHGNPSGGDNTTVIFGGLLWFRGESLPFTINSKIQNFILIQSDKPVESTKEMIEIAKIKIASILENQELLTKQMLLALKMGNEKILIDTIRKGEKNLEKIGVVGKIAKKIIRDIENLGGASKISGAGGAKDGSGILLCYHKNPKKILQYAKQNDLENFTIKLGEEGLRREFNFSK